MTTKILKEIQKDIKELKVTVNNLVVWKRSVVGAASIGAVAVVLIPKIIELFL